MKNQKRNKWAHQMAIMEWDFVQKRGNEDRKHQKGKPFGRN